MSYNNIGNVYHKQNNYEGALKNYFTSLQIRETIGDLNGIATSNNNIASVCAFQGNYTEALKNYFAALKIREEIGDKHGIASCLISLGSVNTKLNKLDDAQSYLKKGLALSKEIGSKDWIRDVYLDLAILDSTRGDFKGAYDNHKLYILYRDDIDNEETKKKTIQSQMTYDFEKKEAVADAEHKKELENQEAIAKEKNRKQKLIITFVIAGLFLVLIFAGFIFRSLRITRKQKDIIEQQKNLVEEQKEVVEQQKLIVEEHQKDIIDSIRYARRIQRSLLPTEKYIDKNLNRLNRS
jgi:tetratricopeptide (TPR) repeat protein